MTDSGKYGIISDFTEQEVAFFQKMLITWYREGYPYLVLNEEEYEEGIRLYNKLTGEKL